ncbi:MULTISPECIES: hypothetical protein [Elizabethkingia]|uniref:hypothetical protein n=1 Tax=Elizabethkingia TaxID=308865 RepID=UPI00129485E0|nr:hypothetical protein [Elizabethkingia meningoseptica]
MYYRNKIDISSYEGIEVDAGALWLKKGELMILVDEDEHVTTAYDESVFDPA